MFSDENDALNRQHPVDEDRLLTMTNKILNMRQKLDSVNRRFDFIRHELTDQNEYVAKLAKIKEVLEEQESILKKEVVEIAQAVLLQKSKANSRQRVNISQITKKNSDDSQCNLQKCEKEKYNKMVKLRTEIEEMKDFEYLQNERLEELQRIKTIICRLVSVNEE